MKDNFSKQAEGYSKFRPSYPQELYEYLIRRCSALDLAWDCGTGNGQVASVLAHRFGQVIATDISQAQLNLARKAENILYQLTAAEESGITSNSVNLITVAQAIHWFDFDAFYKEVVRVAEKDCLLAYWAYDLPRINTKIDRSVVHFHDKVIGPYWDLERGYWRKKYKNIQYPLRSFEKKTFTFRESWEFKNLQGYLNSWSGVQHYIDKNGQNPVFEALKPLQESWKKPIQVKFPIFLYAGLV
ncbi:MAG: class I SAM-dependent methyltransferase [Bacteroidota bacterium]